MAHREPMRNEPWITRPIRVGRSVIKAAGLVRNVPGLDPVAMRVLGAYGVIYMVSVDGFYRDANGAEESLRPGDVVWIHPGLAHAYGPREGSDWVQIYVVMEGAPWEHWAAERVLDVHRPVTHAEPIETWRRRFEQVFRHDGPGDRAAALRTMGGLVQLVMDLLATHNESQRSPGEAWLEESLRLLGEINPGAPLVSPREAARKVGLSYENFRKQFVAKTGVSPGQFQKRRRIERACAAIYQGEHSFKALATDLGFCDVFHFSKAFKQIVGDTPSTFRRRARGH